MGAVGFAFYSHLDRWGELTWHFADHLDRWGISRCHSRPIWIGGGCLVAFLVNKTDLNQSVITWRFFSLLYKQRETIKVFLSFFNKLY